MFGKREKMRSFSTKCFVMSLRVGPLGVRQAGNRISKHFDSMLISTAN